MLYLLLFEILNFVQYTIQTRKVNLLVIDKIKRNKQTYTLAVDSKLLEITISVSGANPQITIIDPSSIISNETNKKITFLSLHFSYRTSSQSTFVVYTSLTFKRSLYLEYKTSNGKFCFENFIMIFFSS